MTRRGLAVVIALAPVGCFKSDFLQGLPCESDSECGDLKCEQGFCGGDGGETSESESDSDSTTGTASTVTFTATSATTMSTEESSSTRPVTVTETTSSSSTDPTDPSTGTGSTTDPVTSSTTDPSESSSSTGPGGCQPSGYEPCDEGLGVTPGQAFGVDCLEDPMTLTPFGDSNAHGNYPAVGGHLPREGAQFAVITSGYVDDMFVTVDCSNSTSTNDLGDVANLPVPLNTTVPALDCTFNDAGIQNDEDCSETLEPAITQSINDYVEFRIEGTVPDDATSFRFDFAFATTEYPTQAKFDANDLFVAWLDSEEWSGNIAVSGSDPVSVKSPLLLELDDDVDNPLFTGTCLEGNGGTGWLRVRAPVEPGESFLLVLSIFDQLDGAFDSMVFVDNFRFDCEALASPVMQQAPDR